MGLQAYKASEFIGVTPAVDPRQSEKLFALGGKNYVFDALGPKSIFGNRYLTPYPVGAPEHIQSCRLKLNTGDRVFHFMGDCIAEWREDLGGWRVIYVTGNTTIQPYRWTFGFLNGIMYFCHPSTGLLAYYVDNDICLPVVVPGVPVEAIAMAINNGRLCIMDEENFSWSGPGDGLDWTPRIGGAGFQKINDRVSGAPIMLTAYARGCLTWTSGGVLRSEFTGDGAVYRHRAISTEYRPINSFCTYQSDENTVVILDERGFFSSQGESPQAMTPLFNEFLLDYLQRMDLKLGQNVRIEWDDLQKFLFLSLSLSESNPLYEKAFVLYPSIDKWGTFDEWHYGIGPIQIKASEREDDYFGFTDRSGRIRYWSQYASRETLPSGNLHDSRYPLVQTPAHAETGNPGVTLSSSVIVNTVPESNYLGVAGYSDYGAVIPSVASVTGLDSILQMGLIRGGDGIAQDHMIEVSNVFIGSVISGAEVRTGEDYNLIPDGVSDEDYNVVDGHEDFGFEEINYVNHGIRIIGTMDGKTAFQSVVPDLVRFDTAARFYSCGVVGLWHILELSAINLGEAYHLRVFELTVADAGRVL